jgi:hypothetical protein
VAPRARRRGTNGPARTLHADEPPPKPEGGVTTGGKGIPRLQELTYLEVAAIAVDEEVPFEGIRRRLVDHMVRVSEANPGTGNTALYTPAIENPKRYVRNVSESLKELMRLGLVHQANLPATASSAHVFRDMRYALTESGKEWSELLRTRPAAAYDHLTDLLAQAHPQFVGFLRLVSRGFAVPTARWTDPRGTPSRHRYVEHLARATAELLDAHNLGWRANEGQIRNALDAYTSDIAARAEARGRSDPFLRNQDFVGSCEEALVKFAFTSAGEPIDYISHEILRRWMRTLALASFSYHVPGPSMLRFWPTAELEISDAAIAAVRHVGPEWRERALGNLGEAYERCRVVDGQPSLWVPIYRLRAAVCSRIELVDREFDHAVRAFLAGELGQDLPFRVNVDPALYGNVPPSERPLIVQTKAGARTYHSISVVPRRPAPIAPESRERSAL